MSSSALGSRSARTLLASAALVALLLSACGDRTADLARKAFDDGEYDAAMDLWMPLAEEGNAEAQFGLGYLYEKGLGVPEDPVEAIRWYRMAAEQGHASSQLNLGTLYQTGRGAVASDLDRAADWYRMAAEQGHAKAQYYLGKMYYKGRGLPKRYDLAFEWLQKAADQGHMESVNHLGMLYSHGLGVKQDPRRGFELIQQAAEAGDPSAQLNLTNLYVRGNGTEQDYVEALKWYTIFQSHGILGGGLPLDWVDDYLSEEQLAEAQRRADAWLAEHPPEPEP